MIEGVPLRQSVALLSCYHRRMTTIRAPRGSELSCKAWPQEAALRMLMNNLDPDVAERPEDLIVYGGGGKAARNWESYEKIVATLRRLENHETLLVQSGKPVGVFRTHEEAPRVLIANSHLVPRWATWDEFRRLDQLGLTMYGQMTAGSWPRWPAVHPWSFSRGRQSALAHSPPCPSARPFVPNRSSWPRSSSQSPSNVGASRSAS